MKKLITILSLLMLPLLAVSQSVLTPGQQDTALCYYSGSWTTTAWGLIYLPWDYGITSKNYPLIISLPGDGEKGSNALLLENNGLPNVISAGHPPYSVNGKGDTTWFIVLSVQPAANTAFSPYVMNSWWTTLLSKYNLRIDTGAVFETGYSSGGNDGQSLYTFSLAGSSNGWHLKAFVDMSPGVIIYASTSTQLSGSKIWFFHGYSDSVVYDHVVTSYNQLSGDYPDGESSTDFNLTYYDGGHGGWTTFYAPTWKLATDSTRFTVSKPVGMSLYDWLMQYASSAALTPPTVTTSGNQTLPGGTTSATVSGSATTTNGSITGYLWTQTSGSTVTITSPTSTSTTITGLTDGDTYTFSLTATDDSSQSASASVQISVLGGTDTLDYQIPISDTARFWNGDTVFYQINDPSSSGIVDSLFDEQNSTTPLTTFTSGIGTKMYYPATIVLDLGGFYKITKMSYYDVFGTDTFCIDKGSPYQWDSVDHEYENGNGWENINDTFYTRYLHIYYKNKGNQKVRELKLYGHLVDDSLTRTPPAITIPTKTDTTMGAFMGVNQIGPSPVDSVGQLARHYEEYQWEDTVTTTHNVDSIQFVYNIFGSPTSSSVPSYYFFPDVPNSSVQPTEDTLSKNWLTWFDCFNGVPVYLSNEGLVKPIDPAIFPDRDSTNALEYTRMSRQMWTYAALWGSKTYPADSMQTPYPSLSGLNERKYLEEGNEYNQDWSSSQNHYSPAAYTAYASAFYDGDKGLMGSRMGAKTADSSMTIIMAGTAGATTDYLQGIQYASYYTRPDHSVPFDVINFHTYPTNGSNGDGTNPHAYSPEQYFATDEIQDYIQIASYLMPGKPIWLTEWGYDRNGVSPLSVPPINGQDSAQTQAAWVARFWFMLSFIGIQRSTIFQLHNDALGTMYDSVGYTKFNTTGLADGHYVGNQFSTQNATSWYAYPVWYYQSTIWRRLYNYKPDTILHANVGGDSLYVYRYVNVSYPDSVAYVVWSGTQTNRILNNYVLRTGHSSTPIEQVTLADKYMDGVDTVKSADANGNLPITITESPKLYFTTLSSIGGTLADSSSSQMNTGPTLNISNQSTSKDTTVLVATATPGNSPVISYKWKQLSGPAIQFSLPSQNQNDAQVGSVNKDSTYTFKVIAMDANGLTDSKTLTLNGGIIPPGTKPRVLLYIINGKIVLINN